MAGAAKFLVRLQYSQIALHSMVHGHLDEGDGQAGEGCGDEEEDFPPPDIGQRTDQWGREEAEDPLHRHHHPVPQHRLLPERRVQHLYHRGGDQA